MSELTSDQQRAIEAMDVWFESTSPTESSFFCLQGYAGVGKTWLVGYWLERLYAMQPDISVTVVAPTNKAVDVLRGKVPRELPVSFRTLDSYLGFRIKRDDDWQVQRSRTEKKGDDGPDLVICDEASMVKDEYHHELRLRRVPVLYVGDPAQLQPVGEALSPAFSVPDKVLMMQIVRQAQGNPIIELATHLRKLIEADSNDFILQDLRSYATQGDRRIAFTGKGNVHQWAEAALDKGMDCRILAFTNAAVAQHNATMHERAHPGTPLFGEGELVLVNEAFDYDDDTLLTNGQLLRVVSCERTTPIEGVDVFEVHAVPQDGERKGDTLRMLVARDQGHALSMHKELTGQWYDAKAKGDSKLMREIGLRRAPLNKLAPLRHAYACTVHKSQGSTYDVALVDFSDVYRSREMRSRLLYVAATRPSQFLVMVHNG